MLLPCQFVQAAESGDVRQIAKCRLAMPKGASQFRDKLQGLVSRNRKSFRAYLRRRPLLLQQRGRFGALKHVPLTYSVVVSPLHQVNMDMTLMIGICPVAEYGRKP